MKATPDIDSVTFDALRDLLAEWAADNEICAYPEALARDAANYIHQELLGARGEE